MFAGTALSVRLFVCVGLSLFIIYGPYLYVVVCVFYAYNLTHRVVIPQTQDLTRLPDFPDTVNCIPHVKDKEMDLPHMERKVWAQILCKAAAPRLKMLQK